MKQAQLTRGVWRLSPLTADDESLFINLYSSPKVMRQIVEPLTPEQARRQLQLALAPKAAGNMRYWRIEKEPIIHGPEGAESTEYPLARVVQGIAALIPHAPTQYEVGVMLLPAASRQGAALEAAAMLSQFTFSTLEAELVTASHRPGNLPVPQILRRLHMVCIAQTRQLWQWQISRNEWLARVGLPPYEALVVEN